MQTNDPRTFLEFIRRDLDTIPETLLQALQETASIAQALAQGRSAELLNSGGATGLFLQSWIVNDLPNGAELLNDAPYAGIVESGSRPHWPPFRPLFDYMGRVMGISTSSVPQGSKYDLSDLPIFKEEPALEQVRQAALSVARHIAAHGTKPKYILAGLQATFEQILQQRLNEIAAR
jgi:hypothetical protein